MTSDRFAKGLGAGERLLTPGEVAALFAVDPKTVTRWARNGKLNAIRTLGGHRRYRASEVKALLDLDNDEPGRGAP
jgi:excisionase family DNA binding protein